MFAIDICVNFRTAFFDSSGTLIRDSRLIAKNYMKFWFWVDLAATIPYDLFALVRRAACRRVAMLFVIRTRACLPVMPPPCCLRVSTCVCSCSRGRSCIRKANVTVTVTGTFTVAGTRTRTGTGTGTVTGAGTGTRIVTGTVTITGTGTIIATGTGTVTGTGTRIRTGTGTGTGTLSRGHALVWCKCSRSATAVDARSVQPCHWQCRSSDMCCGRLCVAPAALTLHLTLPCALDPPFPCMRRQPGLQAATRPRCWASSRRRVCCASAASCGCWSM
eukprot:353436-Chlamydomonas_euryale.AAC.19